MLRHGGHNSDYVSHNSRADFILAKLVHNQGSHGNHVKPSTDKKDKMWPIFAIFCLKLLAVANCSCQIIWKHDPSMQKVLVWLSGQNSLYHFKASKTFFF